MCPSRTYWHLHPDSGEVAGAPVQVRTNVGSHGKSAVKQDSLFGKSRGADRKVSIYFFPRRWLMEWLGSWKNHFDCSRSFLAPSSPESVRHTSHIEIVPARRAGRARSSTMT